MSKNIFKTIGGYFSHLSEKKWRWLLICTEGKYLDHSGYLQTRREWHPLHYFDTKEEALDYLNNDVSKSDREDWRLYKLVDTPNEGEQQ